MKHPKMDRYLVSEQEHEIDYIAAKLQVSREQVREAVSQVGHSRRKVYKYLREQKTVTNG